jgi:hypothetical protein
MGWAAGWVAAKPPELPVNEKVDCKEQPRVPPHAAATETPTAGVVVLEEQDPRVAIEFVPIDAMTPCWCAWINQTLGGVFQFFTPQPDAKSDYQFLKEYYWSRPNAVADQKNFIYQRERKVIVSWQIQDRKSTVVGTTSSTTCPYLQRKDVEYNCSTPEPARISESVLENLSKLELAQKVFQAAEECRRDGGGPAAEKGYRLVQELCPGSRWEQMASERLNEVRAARAGSDAAYSIHIEESSAAEEQTAAVGYEGRPAPAALELKRALNHLVDMLREGADVEIDLSPHASRRVQCEVHVGGTMYKVVMDEQGNMHYSRQALTSR